MLMSSRYHNWGILRESRERAVYRVIYKVFHVLYTLLGIHGRHL